MNCTLLAVAGLLLNVCVAVAQPVTVIGPITPGNVPSFSSTTIIKDSGITAGAIVSGPGSSTDRAIATWNGTTGALLRDNSGVTINASGRLTTTSVLQGFGASTTALGNTVGYDLNSAGANFGQIFNIDAHTWALGYGVNGAGSASGTSVIKWTDNGSISLLPFNGIVDLGATGRLINSNCTGPRLAKTANYTVLNADKGSLFALGGSTFFTLTFNAASGYDANFGVCVTNEDTVRMKFLAINGFTGPNGTAGYFICPGATEWITNDNNVWKPSGPRRCVKTPTVFVTVGGTDWTTGTNDCLATGSGCGTPQKAYDLITWYFDTDTGRATISVDSGTYTLSSGVTFISMLGPLFGGNRSGTQGVWLEITLAGTINLTNANLIACDLGCGVIVDGTATVNLTGGSGNQGNCYIADNGGQIIISGTITCAGNNGTPANHIAQANLGSSISANSGILTSGTFNNALFSVVGNANFAMDSQTLTFSAATTAAAVLDARGNSYIEFLSNTITNPGSFTGAQYNILGNAYVDYTGTTLPGTASTPTAAATVKNTSGTFGAVGTVLSIIFNNATSGTITVQPVAGALGTVTLSLPAATDTLIGKATTDIFTNKTFDTAGAGNVFKINGTQISAITGTGSAVLATSPTFVTSIIDPLVIGGAAAGSILELRSTSGTGSGDIVKITGGTNGSISMATFTQSGGGSATVLGGTLNVQGMANVATTSAVCFNTGNGLLTYDGTIGTCTVSDERFKNMGPRIADALNKLLRIEGVYFTWKDTSLGVGRQIGVGAQTVERVFPELVSTDSLGTMRADYMRLVAPIIEALRELKASNDNLSADLAQLRKAVNQ